MTETLRDLGERRILSEIIPLYATGVGDDCAEVVVDKATLVVTTDPVPPPAAEAIGGDPDPYWMGWLLVTINASDVAAAGGRPRSFLSALEMPPEWPVSNLHRLLKGVSESCSKHGFSYIGGNIKEAGKVSATGIAIGDCVGRAPLRRSTSQIGDVVVSIGQGGQFWSDALFVYGGGSVQKDQSPLFRPVAQSQIVYRLAEQGLLRCGMDVSDGLLPTIQELSSKSGNRFTLDMELLTGDQRRGDERLADGRAWLGWGDWNVITTVAPERVDDMIRATASYGGVAVPIGRVAKGGPGVDLTRGDRTLPAPRLESERFAADSWISKGIQGYIDELLTVELP